MIKLLAAAFSKLVGLFAFLTLALCVVAGYIIFDNIFYGKGSSGALIGFVAGFIFDVVFYGFFAQFLAINEHLLTLNEKVDSLEKTLKDIQNAKTTELPSNE